MNLKNFVLSLFSGLHLNGELNSIRAAARSDAKQAVGTYLDEFEAEASRQFAERRQRFLGLPDPNVVDVEVTKPRTRKLARR